jgi:SAM-dependent methyltransferase
MSLSKEFLDVLCCPKRTCRGDLEVLSQSKTQELKCKSCAARYPIIENIPLLFPNASYSNEMHKRHWDQKTKATNYRTKYNNYLKKKGTPWGLYTHLSELGAVKKLTDGINFSGKTFLDCGCGNGRMLSSYPETLRKIGIDASLELLLDLREREPDFWLLCGQLEDMPLKDCIADFSLSVRVFQHVYAPDKAFSEMVRVTHPSGFVALENYNKFNLKEVYKRFRMLTVIDRIKPWGLKYDRYDSYKDIEKWCRDSFVTPLKYCGAGWGVNFYLLDLFMFRRFAPSILQKLVYRFFLFLDDTVGTWPFLSVTMEKVCFLGSVQNRSERTSIIRRMKSAVKSRKGLRRVSHHKRLLINRNSNLVGNDKHHLQLTIGWLKRAQDATPDAGVSRGFSLVWSTKFGKSGWQPSYPETTGYIIPTMIAVGDLFNDDDLVRRARLMADWEIKVMLPNGSAQGGNLCKSPRPAIFDTGQVIRGLLAIHRATGEPDYQDVAMKAARFILDNEHEKKGHWLDYGANCVDADITTYDIYAIAPIVRLGLELGATEFLELGSRVGNFTLKMQNDNGWFENCGFTKTGDPLLHTIGYTIDGLWDVGQSLENESFMRGVKLALDGVLSRMDNKGNIPGRLDKNWEATVDWACLTGIAQIGVTCLKIYNKEGESKYLDAAVKAKEFLKACQNNIDDGFGGGLGAMWGSWPIEGEYQAYQALNWSAKYFADLLSEFISNEYWLILDDVQTDY